MIHTKKYSHRLLVFKSMYLSTSLHFLLQNAAFCKNFNDDPSFCLKQIQKYQSYLLTAMKNDLDFSIKLERFFLEMIIWQLPAKVLQVSNFTHKKSWHPPIPPWDKENCEIFNTHFFIVCNIRIYLPQCVVVISKFTYLDFFVKSFHTR